jgi:hypothetical protein
LFFWKKKIYIKGASQKIKKIRNKEKIKNRKKIKTRKNKKPTDTNNKKKHQK